MTTGIYKRTKTPYWLGKKRSEGTKKKIGLSNSVSMRGNKNGLGHILSEELKRKLNKKGFKFSKKSKQKMSLSRVGRFKGEKSPNWRGGISFEPYSVDWTETLKRSIRERDKYICQICKEPQGDRALDVHHIDYNKNNCDPKNLISLCNSCHMKTNFNREYWKKYFENK